MTPWPGEEMLDGPRPSMDNPVHARTARSGLLQRKLVRACAELSVMSPPRANLSKEAATSSLLCSEYVAVVLKTICLRFPINNLDLSAET